MVTLASCSDEGGSAGSGPDEGPAAGGTKLTASQFGAKWPLTVKQGFVRCEDGSVIFNAGGTEYGVNGTAKDEGFEEIEAIWKKDPDIPGARLDISPVLDAGLEQCD
jgi:hypothetical protein